MRSEKFQELINEHGDENLNVGVDGDEYLYFTKDGKDYIAYDDGDVEELVD